jgi:hypothetical protein
MFGKNTVAGLLFASAVLVAAPAATAPAAAAGAGQSTRPAYGAPVSQGAMTSGPVVQLGYQMAAQSPYDWTGQQDTCLNYLWTHESGWRSDAINGSSGAYGIAQALGKVPGATIAMNLAGDDYPAPYTAGNPPPWGDSDATTQISWGLLYIKGRYGSPCGAWAHEVSADWY